jgi:hopanoid C-3 methylase
MARKRVRIALVEVPAVDVELAGDRVLDEFTLNHPKYPQMVLASNLRSGSGPDIDIDLVDLKGGPDPERTHYRSADYCGQRLDLWRVGVPFDRVADRVCGVDLVAISANFTCERSMVVQTMEYVKAGRGRAPVVVVGGHDATADPEYYLRRGADLCVLGEGETAIQEIVRAIETGEPPVIPGTARLVGGTLQKDAKRRRHGYDEIVFPDVDLLRATSFDESPDGPLPPDVSPRITSLETSRGCPEACSFCDVSFIVGRYRPVPLPLLEQRVMAFKEAGIRTLQVIDDNLLYRTLPAFEGERGRRTILDLFGLLYDEGFAWEFFNGFQLGLFEQGDGRIDVELIDALYRNGADDGRFVGCFRSYVPLDKVTEDEMSLLRKLKPLPVAEAVVGAIADCGPPEVALGFVIGSVRESPGSLEETALQAERFAEIVTHSSGGRTAPYVLPLCSVPLPGTPDFRNLQDRIAYPADQYPELYNIFTSVVGNDHYTPLDLTRARQRMRDRLNPTVHGVATAPPPAARVASGASPG